MARACRDIIGIFCGGFKKFKRFMIFNFFELGFFIDLRNPSVSRKLQVGVLEDMARDEGDRWGVFSPPEHAGTPYERSVAVW